MSGIFYFKYFFMKNSLLGDYPVHIQPYLDLVEDSNLTDAFDKQNSIITQLLKSITEQQSDYTYAPGKWTLKELLQHCIDAERIFSYRSLCFARKDPNMLPGFEEDDYAANSNANSRTWQSLQDEFFAVRLSTELLFKSFTKEMLNNTGFANNNASSVISIGFLSIGHLAHHINTVRERYLPYLSK